MVASQCWEPNPFYVTASLALGGSTTLPALQTKWEGEKEEREDTWFKVTSRKPVTSLSSPAGAST